MKEFSERIARLTASPIRDILHVLDQPNMISFAGGLPSPESFPAVPFENVPRSQLQYGASEGDHDLREKIASELSELGLKTPAERVLILSGSQQGIDLVGKLFIDPGTKVAVESPTYLAALQVFSLFGAEYMPFDPVSSDTLLKGAKPALTYAIPTFQNPTGHCYTTEQRIMLANTCDEAGITLFEDDPYRELVYEDCDRTPVCALLNSTEWIYQSSFSKTMAPGLRLGYLTASERLFPLLTQLKQAADLHSSRVGQCMALSLLRSKDRASRLRDVVAQYKLKRDYFDHALQTHFSDLAQWKQPLGGLFFWLKLNGEKPVNTQDILQLALKDNVAFMPGEPFYPMGDQANTIRLNFSHASLEQIDRGLIILASIIRQQLDSIKA